MIFHKVSLSPLQEQPNAEDKPAISVTDSGGVTSQIEDAGKESRPDDEIVPAPEGTPGELASRRPSFYAVEGRSRSRSVGERQWTRVRAVMTWYTRLRRIKKSVHQTIDFVTR